MRIKGCHFEYLNILTPIAPIKVCSLSCSVKNYQNYPVLKKEVNHITLEDSVMNKLFGYCQVTDYAIARRIVDLHSRNEESVDRVYSVEDITRYLMFARQFKPKVTTILR